jgi:hypothetical protein
MAIAIMPHAACTCMMGNLTVQELGRRAPAVPLWSSWLSGPTAACLGWDLQKPRKVSGAVEIIPYGKEHGVSCCLDSGVPESGVGGPMWEKALRCASSLSYPRPSVLRPASGVPPRCRRPVWQKGRDGLQGVAKVMVVLSQPLPSPRPTALARSQHVRRLAKCFLVDGGTFCAAL